MDSVSVRILGNLEVTVGDRVIRRVGSPRQTALLGLLALRAPRAVSVSSLVDGLWDERPPATAVRTLHAHVAHLRRSLAAAGAADLIETGQRSYRLAIAAERIDVAEFVATCAAGKTELAAGKPAVAAATFERALGLWRADDLLPGCDLGEWARAEAVRLTAMRLAAVEDLARACLAAGQPARAIAALEPMVTVHPSREALWELLIQAQRAAGRRDDARTTSQRARAVLAQELGVTPVPLTSFVGRQAELAQVRRLLLEKRLVTLTGPGGCGKSRLAVAIALASGGRVCFVDLATTPGSLPDVADGLFVLDNGDSGCRQSVESLLAARPDLRFLVTSRAPLAIHGEAVVPIRGLPPAESTRLFLARLLPENRRADADADAVAAICAELDGLPLAIEFAAARTDVLTVPEIGSRLADVTRPLGKTVAGSYFGLSEPAKSRFRRLGVFCGAFDLAAARAVWPEADHVIDALVELVTTSLVVTERRADGTRYRLLRTIRRFAAGELADHPNETAQATLGAGRRAYFLCNYPAATGLAQRALDDYRQLTDLAGVARSLALLGAVARERGDFPSCLRRYRQAAAAYRRLGDNSGAATIWQMSGFARWLAADLDGADVFLRRAVGSFRRDSDLDGVATSQVHLAAVAHYRGQPAYDLVADALVYLRDRAMDEGVALALHVLGLVEFRAGNENAADLLHDSLRIQLSLGDRCATASVLEALAATLAHADPRAAAELLGCAAAVRRRIGAPRPPCEQPLLDATTARLRSALSGSVLASAYARGKTLRPVDVPLRRRNRIATAVH